MIPKRYDKFGTVKILTVSRKQWYKNFENPSKFIFIVHSLLDVDQIDCKKSFKFQEYREVGFLKPLFYNRLS